jgi:hypothetical protein
MSKEQLVQLLKLSMKGHELALKNEVRLTSLLKEADAKLQEMAGEKQSLEVKIMKLEALCSGDVL